MPKAKSKTGQKRMRTRTSAAPSSSEDAEHHQGEDYISQLSLELLEKIFHYLELRTIFSCERLNHHFQLAVHSYLKVVKDIDLTEHLWYGYVPKAFTLSSFTKILKCCPKLEVIRGLHIHPERAGLHPYLDRSDQLSQGIVKELKKCPNLRRVEISNLDLADALVDEMPELDLGRFSNRGGCFEADCRPYFTLVPNYRITKLHLTGVTLPELPETPHVKEVILEWVELTSSQPFQNFICPALRTFVMRNCFGPLNALKYVALIDNLARCLNLERLELVRVPFLGGLIQHKVEESAQECTHGFRNLKTVIISGCKNCTEQDLGHLLLAACKTLESLSLQPCLTRDSLFLALKAIDVKFHSVKHLHLGYVDPWSNSGKYSPAELVNKGLAEINENPALMTDMGMNAMGQVFPNLTSLTIYNCPHLRYPRGWLDVEPVDTNWSQLQSLHLHHCHGIQLNDTQSLSHFIEWLPNLEDIHLERMFPKPPKGCSRVGLSAGTGIGVSSALVAMQNPGAQHPPQPQNQAEVQVPDIAAPINQEPLRQHQQADAERPAPPRQIQDAPAQNIQPAQERHQESHRIQPGINENSQARLEDHSAADSNVESSNVNKVALHQQEQSSDSSNTVTIRTSEQASTSMDVDRTTNESKESNPRSVCKRKHSSTSIGVDTDDTDDLECDEVMLDDPLGRKDKGDDTDNACLPVQSNKSTMDPPSDCGPSFQSSTPKRNVRDASTSAMSVAGSCPIHGKLMQELSNDDDDDEVDSSSPDEPSKESEAGTCQSVGVQVQHDTHLGQSSPPDPTPMMCDQATSTSDPVMESDPVLVFRCDSQSLTSATFDDCGISHIQIEDCPNLKSIQGHNLPIFKHLSVSDNQCNLSRVQFEQCPKMQYKSVVGELIFSHPAGPVNRFLRFRPMSHTAVDEIKGGVETRLSCLDHNALIIIDGTSPPQAHHSTSLWDWIHVFSGLNQQLVFEGGLQQAQRRSLCGFNEDGIELHHMVFDEDRLEVITDLPWMKPLLTSKTMQLGVSPSFGNDRDTNIQRLKEHLSEPIAMAMQDNMKIFPSLFCVYIQTSDLDGNAIHGEFTANNY